MPKRSPVLAGAAVVLALAALQGCFLSSIAKVGSTMSEMSRSSARGDPLRVAGYEVSPARARPAFVAGAASVDITPPPGFPTGGHGPAGDVARGHWLRLRARAFVLEDRAGRACALVSADLLAVPRGLHARVAQLVAERLSAERLDLSLPPSALVVAAIHTHQGPGNFLTARIYNEFGSSYPGFSAELFQFLAHRIAAAVTEAARDARAHAQPVHLAIRSRVLGYGLVRNRSPWVFELNRDRERMLSALDAGAMRPSCTPLPGEPPEHWDLANCPRLRAADRNLTILELARVEGGQRRPFAALLFFAAHPTVLEASTPFYSPDFAGFAAQAVEADLGAGGPVVVGFFNGAEGDVTMRRTRRDLADAAKLGADFAHEVLALLAEPPDRVLTNPDVATRATQPRPRDGSPTCRTPQGAEVRLASAPRFGAAALGGAEGDRTVLYDLGWRDGVRDRATAEQGAKLPALDSRLVRALRFSDEFAPADAFPDALPVGLVTIGDLTLATLPAEVTTAQGLALRARLGGLTHGHLEIVGLANEYASYCSSSDEYSAQDYMGASTIWGPGEGSYLACALQGLAAASPAPPPAHVAGAEFFPGTPPRERFGRDFTSVVTRPDDGLEGVLRDASGLPERNLPWFAWPEEPPPAEFEQSAARRITIWEQSAGAWRELRVPAVPWARAPQVEDDRGAGFLTVYLGRQRWGAIWLRPMLRPEISGRFMFVVRAGADVFCSRPFEVARGRPGPDEVERAEACPATSG